MIAAVRNPSTMPVVKTASGSRIIAVKYDAGILSAAADMFEVLKRDSQIDKLDIVRIAFESSSIPGLTDV